jgi:hypothetical protein
MKLFEIRDAVGCIASDRAGAGDTLTFTVHGCLAAIVACPRGARPFIITGAGDKGLGAGNGIGQFRDFRTADGADAFEVEPTGRNVDAPSWPGLTETYAAT